MTLKANRHYAMVALKHFYISVWWSPRMWSINAHRLRPCWCFWLEFGPVEIGRTC